MTYLGGKVLEWHTTLNRHMYFLLVPGRPVVGIHAQSYPSILGPVVGLFLGERPAHNYVAVLHKVIDIVLCWPVVRVVQWKLGSSSMPTHERDADTS
jgi:hypothetical protein